MSELIVDFPRRCTTSASGGASKAVTFAPQCTVTFLEPNGDNETSKLWYSQAEHRDMSIANRRAAQEASRMFASLSSGIPYQAEEPFDPCMLTGIERILTPALIRKTRTQRRQCLNAVLIEQDRISPEELAQVSRNYSNGSVARALKRLHPLEQVEL